MLKGLGLAASLADGSAAGAAGAEAEAEAEPPGGSLLSRVHGLGFDGAAGLACAAGSELGLGLQPPSGTATDSVSSNVIGRFMFGFLRYHACTTSRKAFANRRVS